MQFTSLLLAVFYLIVMLYGGIAHAAEGPAEQRQQLPGKLPPQSPAQERPGMGSQQPGSQPQAIPHCCLITQIDARSGLVTAQQVATRQTFQFGAPQAILPILKVGQRVWVDSRTQIVSVEGAPNCCKLASAPQTPPQQTAQPATKSTKTTKSEVQVTTGAPAVKFTVDATSDAVDASPGDGQCRTTAGRCTLRAAIMEANALPGSQTITLPNGVYKLTIAGHGEDAGKTGDLDITDHLAITGANTGATVIDGNGLDRIFDIFGPVTVRISRLTVRNGKPEDFAPGGGIRNAGNLNLDEVLVSGNTGGGGAAIYNFNGSTRIVHSSIKDNNATGILSEGTKGVLDIRNTTISGNKGGRYLSPGGVWNSLGTLTITDSSITGNSCDSDWTSPQYGGGVQNDRGEATLVRVTVSGNSCRYSGGGVANVQFWFSPIGKLTITDSVISRNSAMHGGGIMNYSQLTLTNVTLSANVASGRAGCLGTQLATDDVNAPYAVTTALLSNVTIVGCRASSGGGIFNWAPGPFGGQSQSIQLRNTALANNQPENCVGTITSLGSNLDSGSTCGFTKRGDRTNADLKSAVK